MSKLDELITEMCPAGVVFDEVGNLCKTLTPRVKVKSNDYLDEGLYPVVDQGQEFIGGYTNEEGVFPEDEYVVFGDHTCVVKYIDFAFAQGADGVKVLCADRRRIIPRYLFHCMSNIKLDVSYARHWSKMRIQKVPVPPIEIQREIVRILDKFTGLTAELAKEHSARKQQYEYYLDLLLGFNDDIPKYNLGDLCEIKGRIGFRGYTQKDFVDEGKGAISLSPGNIIDNHLFFDNCKYISWEKYEESPEIMISESDVILCKTGSTVGKVAVVDSLPEKTTLNPQLVVLKKIKCNHRYLFYQLTRASVQREIKSLAGIGSVPNISQKAIASITIPVPEIEEQLKLVNILDRFDSICNSVSDGIPAEIEARKKQYEYYRDKLLTFKEA